MANTLAEAGFKGELAHRVVFHCVRDLVPSEPGGEEDRRGIDAKFKETRAPIQIKFDETIAKTKRIWLEFFEKTLGFSDQLWRFSPHECAEFFFVTEGYFWRLPVDVVGRILYSGPHEIGPLPGRKRDSIGVFIGEMEVVAYGDCVREEFDLSEGQAQRWMEAVGRRWLGTIREAA